MRIFCAMLLAGVFVCSGINVRAELANGIRAIVNDTVITHQQVEAKAAQGIDLLRRRYATQPEVFRKKYLEAMNDALEDLVGRQLVLHDFKTSGFNMPESILDEFIQEEIRQRYGDRITLIKTLQAERVTYEEFHQQMREKLIFQAMVQKNVSSEFLMSPHKIEAYYEQHRDKFKMDDEIKLRMIVLDSSAADSPEGRKKLAQEILHKLEEGAPFAEMATIYSTGSQRKEGGNWGWVERPVLRKELADVAFTLQAGQRSGVIETPDACYLMLVEETRAAHVKPLNEIRDEIEKTLLTQERDRLQKQWIERLRNKMFIRYF